MKESREKPAFSEPRIALRASVTHALRGRRYRLLVWALLAGATLAAHGRSLGYGLFLDDHWHQARIREMGWSIAELLDATTIDPERIIHSWWQERSIHWRYSRPVSILLMKIVHHMSGGSAAAHHAVSLFLHFAAACMVHGLCMLLTRHRFWSIVGALLFVVYSHGVFAVGWLAAQNAVLQTALMLAALLCYIRASGLNVGPTPVPGVAPHAPDFRPTETISGAARLESGVPSLNLPALTLTFLLWWLAVFSRESAVMFPAIMLAFDAAFGGKRHLWARRWVHLSAAALVLAYVIWRMGFYHHPIPDVYVRRPDGWGYTPWLLAKLMHYLCCAVWQAPMVIGPTGRQNPFREVPGDCLLMFVILAVMAVGYHQTCRNARGYWIWPMWVLLAVLPVTPVLATPHSGYLCGVGFSIAVVLGPGLGRAIAPVGMGRWCRPIAIGFLLATCAYLPIYRTLWEGMMAAERLTLAEVAADPPSERVTDVFFLNLPFVNIYAEQSIGGASDDGARVPRCHVLTYAPRLLGIQGGCTLKQRDEHSFSISVAGRPYFSGLLGRFLIKAMRDSGPFEAGRKNRGKLFDVRILRADAEGVRELLFTFHEPLADERYRFYLSTAGRGALAVTFHGEDGPECPPAPLEGVPSNPHNVASAADRLWSGDPAAASVLLDAVASGEPDVRRAAWDGFLHVAAPIAAATGSAVQGVLGGTNPPDDVSRLRDWWCGIVGAGLFDRAWVHRDDFAEIRHRRDTLLNIRAFAGRIIRTDLYMTGPPFDGPRAEISSR